MTRFEKFLTLFTKIRPGEGKGILLLSISGFFLVCAFFSLKALRETLILAEYDAETKAYAVATIALVLFFLVPLYSLLFRYTNRTQLVLIINLFFISNIPVFFIMHSLGISIAFQFYVWLGVFGLMVVAQFWAYAADIYNVKSGQRVFPVIMVATSLGGLIGAQLTAQLFDNIGAFGLMGLACVFLIISIFFYRPARLAAPEDSRCIECEFIKPKGASVFGGFAVVISDQYLRLIALFVVLLNLINSVGEYLLSYMVEIWADSVVARGGAESAEEVLAMFAGNFYSLVPLFGLFIQTFFVAGALRFLGMPRSLLILPVITLIGYVVIGFFPIFTVILVYKVVENGMESSLMTTLRQALFLPTSREVKYEGKTAIETFFWRFGDLLTAGLIYAGNNLLDFGVEHFAGVNIILAACWVFLTITIARHYLRVVKENGTSRPPVLHRPIPDQILHQGEPIDLTLPPDTFVDPDPGDIITLKATLPDGSALPNWLVFQPKTRRFFGHPPNDLDELRILVVASDFENLTASDEFTVSFAK